MAGIIEKRRSLHRSLTEKDEDMRRLEEQIKRTQSLAGIGLISAMVAHEINNILTPVGSYAQLSMNYPDDRELAQKAIRKAAANAARASNILRSLLAMANGQTQEKKQYKLRELADDLLNCMARDFSKDKIKLIIDIPEKLSLYCERVCFQQVLMNLILNARQAMTPQGGQLEISAKQNNDSVIIKVSDTGCGIEKEDIDKIFEPFFTTKSCESEFKQAGAGLGLAFCRKVTDEHGGTIKVCSEPGKGAVFTITLPSS